MTWQENVLSWLKDAHAVEVGALPTLTSHAAAAQDYPEVQAKLNEHVAATRRHAELIEGCLTRLGSHPSAFKEAVGGVMGKVTAVANLPAKDTVIKNALGDYAAENFEIASYRSLVAAAEKIGDQETADVCRQILRDEEEMSGWLGGHIATLTQAYLAGQGETDEGSSGGQGKVAEPTSTAGSKSALLAGGALLAGVGAALLIGQTRREGSEKRERQSGNGGSSGGGYRLPDEEGGAPSMKAAQGTALLGAKVDGGATKAFEHSTTIDASPDEVYAFMSKVENLPKYLPTTHAAQPQQGDRVRVQGEAQGHPYNSDGYFRQDAAAHRIEWGADEGYYSGYLEVTAQGSGSSMTVHLSFSGGPPAGQGDAPGEGNAPNPDQIQEGLVKALESIKNFVEDGRTGGKEEPSAAT